MSGAIVPFGRQAAVRRATSRTLTELADARLLERTQEDARAEAALNRIHNGVALFERSVLRMSMADALITTVSHDRPGFELIARAMQQDLAIGVGSIIREYIDR
jgi:hypothetical protein